MPGNGDNIVLAMVIVRGWELYVGRGAGMGGDGEGDGGVRENTVWQAEVVLMVVEENKRKNEKVTEKERILHVTISY